MVLRIIVALVCLASLAAAETIHLKNGRQITADSVHLEEGRVRYFVGEDSFAIPQELVEWIDTGRGPLVSAPPDLVQPVVPVERVVRWEALFSKIVHEGQVDPAALHEIESRGNPEMSAAAHFTAARHEYQRGDRERARHHLVRSLHYLPEDPAVLAQYAAVLVEMNRGAEAISPAELATRLKPDSADGWMVLGYAYVAADRSRDAIRAWKRSLELQPNARLADHLARAEREVTAEQTFSEQHSPHFTLRYEGGRSAAAALGRMILVTLEAHYADLSRELGSGPRQKIPVILYPNQTFTDVTQAPAWISALNDGKLRIPISGVSEVTPQLSRVLRHELAHSFITDISRGRCPQWLHEGIAQLLEPRTTLRTGGRLSELFQAQRHIPFSALESSFLGFSPAEARVAYDQALAAVEYIHATYGISEIRRILERIGEGNSTEAALRSTIHSSYPQLEQEIARYLQRTYGD